MPVKTRSQTLKKQTRIGDETDRRVAPSASGKNLTRETIKKNLKKAAAAVNDEIKRSIRNRDALGSMLDHTQENISEAVRERLRETAEVWRELGEKSTFTITANPVSTESLNAKTGRITEFADDIRKNLNGVKYEKFNLVSYDIDPDDISGFYSHNWISGEQVTTIEGQEPIIIWSYYSRYISKVVKTVIDSYSYPKGSFWSIQLISTENGQVVNTAFGTEQKSLEDIENIVENLKGTYDSSAGLQILESTRLRVVIGNPGTGRGGTIPSHMSKKYNWTSSESGYCAPMSILMAAANKGKRNNLKARPAYFVIQTRKLCNSLGPEYPDTPSWNMAYVKRASEVMNIRIIVLDPYTKVVLSDTGKGDTIYIYYDAKQQHYFACLRTPGVDDKNKRWCDLCMKLLPGTGFDKHDCITFRCSYCKQEFATEDGLNDHQDAEPLVEIPEQVQVSEVEDDVDYDCDPESYTDIEIEPTESCNNERKYITCRICNRQIPQGCHHIHEATCIASTVKCPDCSEVYMNSFSSTHASAISEEQHKAMCGKKCRYCAVCKSHKPRNHRCVIGKTAIKYIHRAGKKGDKRKLAVFDIECMRDDDGKQVPTLINVRLVPKSLEGETKEQLAARLLDFFEQEPDATLDFTGPDCVQEFCEWVARQKATDFIAHNLRGYDGVIIHRHLRYNMNIPTQPIFAGLKVMSFKFGSNTMMDSLNHVPTSLAKFPETMGLNIPNLKKDYFPHLYNTTKNQNYVGPLPDMSYYEPGKMRRNDRHDFECWYKSEPKDNWDMNRVINMYCRQDTLILALCFSEYRRAMIEINNIDPTRYVTIASYCMAVYKNIMPFDIPTLTKYEAEFARRGFMGGRTEVYKTQVIDSDIEIVDVQSMYPTVQYRDKMPFGVPKIYKGKKVPSNYLDIPNTEGYAQLDFQSPITVPGVKPIHYVPLLGGYDDNGKLVFDTKFHSQQVVSLAELRVARDLGYSLTNVTEVHIYEARSDLFESYVEKFLKIKVESSEPPEDIDKCIHEHKVRFGIDLDPIKLREPKNDGMRTLAKLCLNSLWGKLSQREHVISELCDPESYFKLIQRWIDKEIDITSVEVEQDLEDTVCVKYYELKHKQDTILSKTNVAIGAYVTAQARLRLYQVIGDPKLAGRVIYCDTDSCMYIYDENNYNVPKGDYLGEWESEGRFTDSAATGPKSYAVQHKAKYTKARRDLAEAYKKSEPIPKKLLKAEEKSFKLRLKGIKFTGEAESLFTMRSMLHTIKEPGEKISVPTTVFARKKGDIFVSESVKDFVYKPEEGKRRVVQGTHDLAPY